MAGHLLRLRLQSHVAGFLSHCAWEKTGGTLDTLPSPVPLPRENRGGRKGAASFSASNGMPRQGSPTTGCPGGNVPVLRVTQLSQAASGPGQQAKNESTCARPASGLQQGREVSHCPCAEATTGTGCGWDKRCAMAGLVWPAVSVVLLCFAAHLEASPELSGESG